MIQVARVTLGWRPSQESLSHLPPSSTSPSSLSLTQPSPRGTIAQQPENPPTHETKPTESTPRAQPLAGRHCRTSRLQEAPAAFEEGGESMRRLTKLTRESKLNRSGHPKAIGVTHDEQLLFPGMMPPSNKHGTRQVFDPYRNLQDKPLWPMSLKEKLSRSVSGFFCPTNQTLCKSQ